MAQKLSIRSGLKILNNQRFIRSKQNGFRKLTVERPDDNISFPEASDHAGVDVCLVDVGFTGDFYAIWKSEFCNVDFRFRVPDGQRLEGSVDESQGWTVDHEAVAVQVISGLVLFFKLQYIQDFEIWRINFEK